MKKFKYIDSEAYFTEIKKFKNIICFGAGGKLREALIIFRKIGIKPTAICDNDPDLWGKIVEAEGIEIEIESYDSVVKRLDDYVILLTVMIKSAEAIYRSLRQTGEKHPIYQFCNPFKVGEQLIDSKEVDKNYANYEKIYDRLADDLSKEIFELNLNYKISGNMLELQKRMEGNSFFDEELLEVHSEGVYIDIGAYTGDSILKYLEYCRGQYKHIYAVEADKGNYAALQNFIKYGWIDNITTFNQALWSERSKKTWYSISQNMDINFGSPNLFEPLEAMIDRCTVIEMGKTNQGYVHEEIQTETLDDLLPDSAPTIMKVNAIAADYQILQGSRKLIKQYKPIIVIEHGVKPENILAVISFLDGVRGDYTFYLRQKKIFSDSKTIMYAI